MRSRGFTVIELLVVIIIMAILLTLAVVNVRSTQMNARDAERRADVENIATVFETFYNGTHAGMYPLDYPDKVISRSYPGTQDVWNAPSGSTYTKDYILSRISLGSLYAPGVDTEGDWSVVAATNDTETAAGVLPRPTTTQYVYQPITRLNNLCHGVFYIDMCFRFSLYYAVEKATPECPAPDNICVIRSKHQ